MTRCFVAILPDDKTRNKVIEVQEEIKKLPMKTKLVEPENLHISLTFLGEKSNNEISEIIKNLEIIANDFDSFDVKIEKIQFIPNKSFIRVLALNVESDVGEKLREVIVKTIGGSSHPLHLTLARVKSIARKDYIVNKLSSIKINECFKVNRIFLMKSQLTRNGPIYTKISEFKLK